MDTSMNQRRVKPSDKREDRKDESSRSRDNPKTSFKEKKRSYSWFNRKYSRHMSWDYDTSTTEYPTAVAAAASAIQSLQESRLIDEKDKHYGPDKSLSKKKSRVKDDEEGREPLKSALKPTGESSRASFKDSDIKVPITSYQKESEKRVQPKPYLKKKISFTDESNKNEPQLQAEQDKAPKRGPSLIRPPTPAKRELNIVDKANPSFTLTKPVNVPPKGPVKNDTVEAKKPSWTRPGPGDSQADAWEREEMASINERYEKTRVIIENWEESKKKKARSKLETTEAELDKKRAKAVKSYNSEIARIEEIAKGAREQADKNRKNEELKTKEKANKIRLTGKLPATCLCF